MGRKIGTAGKTAYLVVFCFTVVLCAAVLVGHRMYASVKGRITALSAATEQGGIRVSWENTGAENAASVYLRISSDSGSSVVELAPETTEFFFDGGAHAAKYTFDVCLKNQNGIIYGGSRAEALYVDWSRISGMRLLNIRTEDGLDPTYQTLPTNGWWGRTITDNQDKPGELCITSGDDIVYASRVKIRVRGNTSAYTPKKPYKLTFDNGVNLTDSDECTAAREWILLKCENLNTFVGYQVASLLQEGFIPAAQMVNLILNGDWKGSYILIESVKEGMVRDDLSQEGYLIENDAYWWNEKISFHTEHQPYQMGYTFQSPNKKELTQQQIDAIAAWMELLEAWIYNADPSWKDCIDIPSFVNWLLVHDILGTVDSAGSNLYLLYEPSAAKNGLRMGTAWDFDANYGAKGQWSDIHSGDVSYFPQLMQDADFRAAYYARWNEISAELLPRIEKFLDTVRENALPIQESWTLDSARWETSHPTAEQEAERIEQWFEQRTQWMERIINPVPQASEGGNAKESHSAQPSKIITIGLRLWEFIQSHREMAACGIAAVVLAGMFLGLIWADARENMRPSRRGKKNGT